MADLAMARRRRRANTEMGWSPEHFVEFPTCTSARISPAHEDLRREPAAGGVQLGDRRARDVAQHGWRHASRESSTSRSTSNPSRKYPMVSISTRSSRTACMVHRAGGTQLDQRHDLRLERYLVFEPDITYDMGLRPERGEVDRFRECRCCRARLRGSEGPRTPGPFVGAVPDGVPRHPDHDVQRCRGGRAGGEHDQLRMAAFGGAPASTVDAVRAGPEPHRQVDLEAPNLYIENSPLFYLDRVDDAAPHPPRDMDDAVPWYRGSSCTSACPEREGGGPDQLQQRAALTGGPAEPAGLRDADDAVLRRDAEERPAPDWMVNGIPAKTKAGSS